MNGLLVWTLNQLVDCLGENSYANLALWYNDNYDNKLLEEHFLVFPFRISCKAAIWGKALRL